MGTLTDSGKTIFLQVLVAFFKLCFVYIFCGVPFDLYLFCMIVDADAYMAK